MRTKINKLLSVLCACVMLFTLLSTSVVAESREITEVFSAQQFSNATLT